MGIEVVVKFWSSSRDEKGRPATKSRTWQTPQLRQMAKHGERWRRLPCSLTWPRKVPKKRRVEPSIFDELGSPRASHRSPNEHARAVFDAHDLRPTSRVRRTSSSRPSGRCARRSHAGRSASNASRPSTDARRLLPPARTGSSSLWASQRLAPSRRYFRARASTSTGGSFAGPRTRLSTAIRRAVTMAAAVMRACPRSSC